ncbi:fatty acid desaturase [Leptospira langatensis]|uniref:Fatty acid desaturase n=1 Tax=Leptospira langatensis TaxID=2484983 RepID=A0A5F1ZQI9_9LEPT|nr:fatty acid desaturase [Leptospira langatensis]TGK05155.1 fatty acid desaturase [Leptospira langatensis]TGL38292.1 fatty acid desaturase [Leptospira langatensis]
MEASLPVRDLPFALNRRLSVLVLLVFVGFHYLLPIAMPSLGGNVWIVWLFAAFLGPLSYTFWNLIHESIHGNFSNERDSNHFWGRLLCIVFGAPYAVLKASHLMHHKFNRERGDRIEFYDPSSWKPRSLQSVSYYFRITVATYLFEVGAGFLLSLPTSWTRQIASKISEYPIEEGFFKWIYRPEVISELRRDIVWVLLFYLPSFYLFGENWPVLVFVLFLRSFFISFFDNAYHYGKEIDDKNSAYNLTLPHWMSAFFLHFNYHRIHHRFPGCSWDRLPKQMLASKETWDKSFIRQAWSQWNGLLEPIDGKNTK